MYSKRFLFLLYIFSLLPLISLSLICWYKSSTLYYIGERERFQNTAKIKTYSISFGVQVFICYFGIPHTMPHTPCSIQTHSSLSHKSPCVLEKKQQQLRSHNAAQISQEVYTIKVTIPRVHRRVLLLLPNIKTKSIIKQI